MRHSVATLIVPCTLLLSACSDLSPLNFPPAYNDTGTRTATCITGGPDSVAQQFYNNDIIHSRGSNTDINALRPYLSDTLWKQLMYRTSHKRTLPEYIPLFTSHGNDADSAVVSNTSDIPNTDARNIPLRVTFNKGRLQWQDEVLMVRSAQCWTIDDIRYLSASGRTSTGTLRQTLEQR